MIICDIILFVEMDTDEDAEEQRALQRRKRSRKSRYRVIFVIDIVRSLV